jgi:hypothetical protein
MHDHRVLEVDTWTFYRVFESIAQMTASTTLIQAHCLSSHYVCDSSREGGRTEEALSRYPDEGSLTKETLEPETAVYTRILN